MTFCGNETAKGSGAEAFTCVRTKGSGAEAFACVRIKGSGAEALYTLLNLVFIVRRVRTGESGRIYPLS